MKKYILTIVSMLCILSLVGCGKKEKFEIEILVPAGSTEAFVYSDEEICPTGNKANQDFFNAVVLEVNGNEILAECIECESGWIFDQLETK